MAGAPAHGRHKEDVLVRVYNSLDSCCIPSTVKFRQSNHEFTFDVDITFVSYPLVLTSVV
jgi:hypothetical protein